MDVFAWRQDEIHQERSLQGVHSVKKATGFNKRANTIKQNGREKKPY